MHPNSIMRVEYCVQMPNLVFTTANIDKSAIDVAGARQMAFVGSLVKDAFSRVPGSMRLIKIINMDIASENMATYLGYD